MIMHARSFKLFFIIFLINWQDAIGIGSKLVYLDIPKTMSDLPQPENSGLDILQADTRKFLAGIRQLDFFGLGQF